MGRAALIFIRIVFWVLLVGSIGALSLVAKEIYLGPRFEREFRVAQIFVDAFSQKYGKLPSDAQLELFAYQNKLDDIAFTLTTEPVACGPDLTLANGDRYLLGFWRGEGSACFAVPSGRSNVLSFGEALRLPITAQAASCLVSLLLGWLAWRIWLRRGRPLDPTPRDDVAQH